MSNNNDYSDHGDIINLHHNDDNDDDIHDNDDNDVAATNPTSSNARAPVLWDNDDYIHDNDDNDVATTNPTSSNARAPVLWSDAEIRVLIDERQERNFEYYYLIPECSRTRFWGSVANTINWECGSNYSDVQCQSKFNGLVTDYNVNKILI